MSLVHYAGTVAAAGWVGLCLWDASERTEYAFLAAGFAWGFLIEALSMLVFGGYHYALDSFAVSIGTVPLQIMLMWAAILYTGWQTGRYLGFEPRRLPFVATLYALHIDVAIDAVAADVPYWIWENGGRWFETPINNYVGWFMATMAFVASFVLVGRYVDDEPKRAALTLPVTAAAFLCGMFVYGPITGPSRAVQTVALLVLLGVSLVVVLTDDVHPRRVSVPLTAVTLSIHVFFAGLGWSIGTYATHPQLVWVALAMFAVGIGLHVWPYWLRERAPETIGV